MRKNIDQKTQLIIVCVPLRHLTDICTDYAGYGHQIFQIVLGHSGPVEGFPHSPY